MEPAKKDSWRPAVPLRIGDFVADATSNELTRPGSAEVPLRLRPILMDVLLRLAVDAGNVVSRENLLADVWSRRMVNDEVLSRAIAELRTALGDDAKQPRYIETLPKVGYRMVASVASVANVMNVDPSSVGAAEHNEPAIESSTLPQHEINSGHVAPALSPVTNTTTQSIWKLIRLPLLGLLALALYGVYKDQNTATIAASPANVEQQLNAAVPLATSTLTESNPRFSPDGKSVIYARSDDKTSEIVVQDIATGMTWSFSVPGSRLATPVYFADGRRIAFWQRRIDTSTTPDVDACAIVVRELATSTDTRIVDCKQRVQPVFDVAPDGRSIVYSALPRSDLPLALMQHDIAAGASKQLTAPNPGDGHDALPRFSPDGKQIAFFRGTQSHVRLWTLSLAEGAMPKPASALEGLAYGVAWSPADGSLIAAADWLGFRALNAVSLIDGSARLLGARGARFPDVHKNGSIVYETATFRADLWLTNAENPGDGSRMLWPSTRYSNQAEFSPDSKSVAFASNRSGTDSIHVAALAGNPGEAPRLPLADNARYIQPHWSADGSDVFAVRIKVTSSKLADQHAVRVNVASGRATELTHLGNKINNAVPLSNGRELIYGELVEHSMRLYRADISGGTPQRLALPLVASYAISGNDLVFTQPQLIGATRCKLDTMACAPIKVELDDSTRFDWTLGNGAIWFVGRDLSRKATLIRYDLETGQRRSFDFAPSAAGTNIAVSRDGKSLIVSREDTPVVDLMIAKPVKAH